MKNKKQHARWYTARRALNASAQRHPRMVTSKVRSRSTEKNVDAQGVGLQVIAQGHPGACRRHAGPSCPGVQLISGEECARSSRRRRSSPAADSEPLNSQRFSPLYSANLKSKGSKSSELVLISSAG